MKIENPAVTLADEARNGVAEEVRSGFLDWLYEFNVEGDDGELYALGGSILSMNLEKMDLVTICMAKGKGRVRQLPESIYKIAEYPGAVLNRMFRNPQGTLRIENREHSILVSCGPQYSVECFDNGRWHIRTDSMDGEYRADLWHIAHGYPLWYGREKPSYLTQHSITYGYNWSGDVEGEFTYQGKTVKVRGTGQRERYVAVDSSAAELGGFVPTWYNIRIEVEDGVYQVRAHVGNARTWGVTFRVPDNPVATLIYDTVEGRYVGHDGTVRELTGGRGTMSIRQWHAYPNILPRELYSDEVKTGEKFDTL